MKRALLQASDLASIDSSLTANDIQPPQSYSSSCKDGTTYPTYSPSRQFADKPSMYMLEQIDTFPSSKAARSAFEVDARTLTCGFSSTKSTNISNQVTGLCDEGYAIEIRYKASGYFPAALYSGVIRCGRILLVLALETPLDSSFDNMGNFVQYAEIAIPKIQALEQG